MVEQAWEKMVQVVTKFCVLLDERYVITVDVTNFCGAPWTYVVAINTEIHTHDESTRLHNLFDAEFLLLDLNHRISTSNRDSLFLRSITNATHQAS